LSATKIASSCCDKNRLCKQAFRQKCLTDHSLISIAESIRYSVDNKNFECGIFIDFKLGYLKDDAAAHSAESDILRSDSSKTA